ncbi:AraC family transcriptional regulator [Caulobacter sp. UNC279MFTsu5.1]|uniref:helix-turn-helix domain-containing protein n=1 Tax=Caulobacter sp. UNC279MFTsu5.1 TaxID=1502775 RepID=UPI000376FDCB|nr:helix-turn-helix domain-containing protein [Caulobacter sp. UNC279MFTsu5.1]SFJ29823.1 Helix-turn-helix domain-containing protein [Caulobacter sp. UNC279MFTsu5.1]
MVQKHTSRRSSHPWIDTVWQTVCLSDGLYSATPDGSWDLIRSIAPDGQSLVFLSGQATEPVEVPYRDGESSVVISFAAHVYLPRDKAPRVGPEIRMLPVRDATFQLDGVDLPLPTFENVEPLVDTMIAAGLLASNDLVARAFGETPKAASPRSVQQHFKQTTGITQKSFQMIRRAQEAVRRLKAGEAPAGVAVDLGYADQPHMIKSIKKIMGALPSNLETVHKI